jgi:hypothetical protein
MISVNSALHVDLMGQVNAEMIGRTRKGSEAAPAAERVRESLATVKKGRLAAALPTPFELERRGGNLAKDPSHKRTL